MADLEAIDPGRTVLMVLDMHRDVVADDGASKDSGAPEHAAKQNVVENIKTLLAAARKGGTPVLHILHRKAQGHASSRQHEPDVPRPARRLGIRRRHARHGGHAGPRAARTTSS